MAVNGEKKYQLINKRLTPSKGKKKGKNNDWHQHYLLSFL